MTTCTQLLEALLDPTEHTAWTEFDRRYRPIIYRFARHLGLGEEAAAEVAQETIVDFSADYNAGKYDRERGRLRTWIIGIARNRIHGWRRARARRREERGDSALDQIPDEEVTRAWDDARDEAILKAALEELERDTKTAPETIRVFRATGLEQVPAEEVANEYGISVAEVYRVKYRLTRRLRAIVQRLEKSYSEDG